AYAGRSKLSCLQLRRLRGGQGRETETGDQKTVSPNELSIAFHFAPTKLALRPLRHRPHLDRTRRQSHYYVGVLLDYIQRKTRVLPGGLQWRKLVKRFRKPKSKYYWYDFMVRGQRYRGSTPETSAARACASPKC